VHIFLLLVELYMFRRSGGIYSNVTVEKFERISSWSYIYGILLILFYSINTSLAFPSLGVSMVLQAS